MARIFYGRRDMLNPAVLEAVKSLGDDFWVLAEFDLDRRNIDWLILRAVPDECPDGRFSTVYLTELKQTSAQLSGGEYGRWSAERNGIAKEIVPNNKADENHWHQVTNVASTVQSWLYANQRRYLSLQRPEYDEAVFKPWPTLLILSNPAELQHRLPLRPANRFGAFHFDLDRWLNTINCWGATLGIQLTAEELGRLVAAIGLQELPEQVVETRPESTKDQATGDLEWLQGFARWVQGIEERLRRLEAGHDIQQSAEKVVARLAEGLKHIEADYRDASAEPSEGEATTTKLATTSHQAGSGANGEPPAASSIVAKVSKVNTDRPLEKAEKECIVTALAILRCTSKPRTMSNLFVEMNRLLGGESLRQRKYNGYGSARAMLDQAAKEGIILYGPTDGTGAPTIYFSSEAPPK